MAKKNTYSKVKKTASKIKKKNAKLYYALLAVVLVVAIGAVVWAVKFPDSFNSVFPFFVETEHPSDNGGNTNPPNEGNNPSGNADYYLNNFFSSKNGSILYDVDANLAQGLSVHFIDVGQGDAIYIVFPNGKDMLIDGGSAKATQNEKLFISGDVVTSANSNLVADYIKRYNADDIIDILILTHTDKDHYSLLPAVFAEFQINTVYLPYVDLDELDTTATAQERSDFDNGLAINTAGYTSIANAAFIEPNCEVKCVYGNFQIEIETAITFLVYALDKEEYAKNNLKADDANELSPICILTYAGRKIVLTGDAEEKSEKDYLSDSPTLDCDVLKVGHHGSQSSTTTEFLDDISPELAIISAGTHSTFLHPRQVTLDKFKQRGIEYYCTIDCGTIVLNVNDKGAMKLYSAKDIKAA